MMVLVTGGSGSGKSAFAEERALSFGNPNAYYAATMEVMDGESVRRVERHRQMREGKGWITLEQPRDIEDITGRIRSYDSVVLVECLTNLVANEMYRGDEECENPKECIGKITGEIVAVADSVENLVVVTGDVFDDGVSAAPALRNYLQVLGNVNRELAAMADEVVEVVVGIPVYLKGDRARENSICF